MMERFSAVGVDFHNTITSFGSGFTSAVSGSIDVLSCMESDPRVRLVVITAFPKVPRINGKIMRRHAHHVGVPESTQIVHASSPFASKFDLLYNTAFIGKPPEEQPDELVIIDNGEYRLLHSARGIGQSSSGVKTPNYTAIVFDPHKKSKRRDFCHPSGVMFRHTSRWDSIPDLLGLTQSTIISAPNVAKETPKRVLV